MNSGALRHVVRLERSNGIGGLVPLDPPTWPAAWLEQGGETVILAGRYHAGIDCTTRVHFRDRIYQVESVQNREARDRELVVTCREVFD